MICGKSIFTVIYYPTPEHPFGAILANVLPLAQSSISRLLLPVASAAGHGLCQRRGGSGEHGRAPASSATGSSSFPNIKAPCSFAACVCIMYICIYIYIHVCVCASKGLSYHNFGIYHRATWHFLQSFWGCELQDRRKVRLSEFLLGLCVCRRLRLTFR